jgi:hypothetical protein
MDYPPHSRVMRWSLRGLEAIATMRVKSVMRRVIHTPAAPTSHRAWQATGRRLVLAALFLSSRNDGHRRIFQEELFTHASREKLLVCLMTMWDGQTCHDVSNPYIRDTAHVASTTRQLNSFTFCKPIDDVVGCFKAILSLPDYWPIDKPLLQI